jgi:hypothetical protein
MHELKMVVYLPFIGASFIASTVDRAGLSNLVALGIIALGGLITIRLNIGKTWQANYEAEKESGRLKDEKIAEAVKENASLSTHVQILEAKTDLTPVNESINTISKTIERQDNIFASHEEHAVERHRQVMEAMQEVVNDLRALRE